ncbi:phosphonopyruvate decarboxylase [Mesotoga sp.]|uniref:phosphonopyruvate decarboxylase n=1 Tax=Mesotoga sp. TaxID=2053577 RepID=UPI001BD515DE|nr:phosphonopyruvate decarboxylase [Mesotoga sp.]
MISLHEFLTALKENGVTLFTGVPDSLLKDFCAYVRDNESRERNIITANEGNAIALAAGHYLGTGEVALAYMQNSGLGNSVNPLTSLVDREVYSIPVLLLIGWRGEPGVKDEPQHVKQGRVTTKLLETLEIPYEIVSPETREITTVVERAVNHMKTNLSPYAIVVKKGSFEDYKGVGSEGPIQELSREEAIEIIVKTIPSDSVIVSTTGKASRELFEIRERLSQGHERDFLTVGSMGHSSSVALGISLGNRKKVFCLDGDGAVIMHMGSMAIIGDIKPKNFFHIVLNNESHESVGGQPTVGGKIDIPAIAKACGYERTESVSTKKDLEAAMKRIQTCQGPLLIEVKVRKGARKDLGRPTSTPIENKEAFVGFLRAVSNKGNA